MDLLHHFRDDSLVVMLLVKKTKSRQFTKLCGNKVKLDKVFTECLCSKCSIWYVEIGEKRMGSYKNTNNDKKSFIFLIERYSKQKLH